MSKQGTCWDGYMQKGMKKKGGKLVPNCVPRMKSGGLTKWFNEKWVDIGSKKKAAGRGARKASKRDKAKTKQYDKKAGGGAIDTTKFKYV